MARGPARSICGSLRPTERVSWADREKSALEYCIQQTPLVDYQGSTGSGDQASYGIHWTIDYKITDDALREMIFCRCHHNVDPALRQIIGRREA